MTKEKAIAEVEKLIIECKAIIKKTEDVINNNGLEAGILYFCARRRVSDGMFDVGFMNSGSREAILTALCGWLARNPDCFEAICQKVPIYMSLLVNMTKSPTSLDS